MPSMSAYAVTLTYSPAPGPDGAVASGEDLEQLVATARELRCMTGSGGCTKTFGSSTAWCASPSVLTPPRSMAPRIWLAADNPRDVQCPDAG